MLSGMRQRKTNTVWYYLYVESKEYNKLVNITRKKQTQRHRERDVESTWKQREKKRLLTDFINEKCWRKRVVSENVLRSAALWYIFLHILFRWDISSYLSSSLALGLGFTYWLPWLSDLWITTELYHLDPHLA